MLETRDEFGESLKGVEREKMLEGLEDGDPAARPGARN